MESTPFAPPMIDVENLNKKEQVMYFSFNQDNTCMAVGTTRGFRIYQCFPFKLVSWGDIGAVRIVEMQYTSNILAIVGDGENQQFSSKRLTIWDTKLNDGTLEISFTSKITKIRLNHELIFVAIKDKIFIFHLDGLKLIDKLEVDHLSRIVLSPSGDMNPYLVYSPSLKEGLIAVYNTNNQKHVNLIKCHKTPILKMEMNLFGNMVATCSTQGSMIRVFSIPQGEKLYTFTRGFGNTTQFSLNFSYDSCFLLSSSSTGTIHVFQMQDPDQMGFTKDNNGNISIEDQHRVAQKPTTQHEGDSRWFSFLVPKTCDDFVSAKKSLMFANHPELKNKMNIIAMNLSGNQLCAFNCDGDFFSYEVNTASERKEIKYVSKVNVEQVNEAMLQNEFQEEFQM